MTPKNVITAFLLLFAAGSAGYVLLGNPSGQPQNQGDDARATPSHGNPNESAAAADAGGPELVVYYMDMGKDCTTCLNLESYTYEALATWYAEELSTGRIAWRTVDLDIPANEHFIDDFGLYTKSVVLVRMADGERVRFDSLSRIWELVYDKDAYIAYVREQVRDFLENPEAPA